MKRLAVCVACIFAAGALSAATTSADLGGVFSDIGVGTRPLGMGGAFTAIADDANATQENPAGMAFFDAKDRFATFTHSDLYSLGFLSRDYVAYAQGDQGYGALGASWDRLSVNLDPGNWAEDEFIFAAAKQIMGFDDDAWAKLSIGLQLKYLRVTTDLASDTLGTSVGGGDASGGGSGLGALLKLGAQFSVGLMAQDIYSSLKWGTGTMELIPPTVKLGLAYHMDEHTIVAIEARAQKLSSQFAYSSGHVGVEHWFLDGTALYWGAIKNVGFRAGFYDIVQNQDSGVLTAGASVKSDMWELDYTYEYGLDSGQLGNTQRFGLGIKF